MNNSANFGINSTDTLSLKLGRRLQALHECVPDNRYDTIWDCCCDHGSLGMALIQNQKAKRVVFNDIVPALINALESKLIKHFPTECWQTSTADLLTLKLESSTDRTLIIIAGVGGELTARFIRTIVKNNPNHQLDFLLCPVRDLYTLRTTLLELDLCLINEKLVKENKRMYEILWVSNSSDNQQQKLNATGQNIWQSNSCISSADINAYQKTLLKHYEKAQHQCPVAREALHAYTTLFTLSKPLD